MSELEEGAVLIDRCGACGGTWYDRGELELAVAAERAKTQSLWDRLPGEAAPETKAVYRSCPLCRQTMLRKRRGPVVIDLCGHHGAFLDAGELEQIAEHREVTEEEPRPQRAISPPAHRSHREGYAEAVTTSVVGVELAIELIASLFLE